MADQGPSDVVSAAREARVQLAASPPGLHLARHGRPVSWVAVTIIMAGFISGGAGLVIGPTWWLFWAGAGLAALGGIVALGSGIFNDWY